MFPHCRVGPKGFVKRRFLLSLKLQKIARGLELSKLDLGPSLPLPKSPASQDTGSPRRGCSFSHVAVTGLL